MATKGPNGLRVPPTVAADATAAQVPRYVNPSTGERRTVDGVLNDSVDGMEHRPRVDDPYVDRLPTAIRKGDTLYSICTRGHVDDFGPGFDGFVLGLGVVALGIVSMSIGSGLYACDR